MARSISLTEHSYIFVGEKDEERNKAVDERTFMEVETFILENSENVQFLRLGQDKKHKYIKAQNYVGVIETSSGTTIEILPKISSEEDIEKEKVILLKMLRTLKDSPFKNIGAAKLKQERMPLLEIFIKVFLEDLSDLIRKGMRSGYIPREENLRFLKGKLRMKEQIQKNTIHMERFYVEYDEFSRNRVENRLIKAALKFLYKKSRLNENRKRIREFLFVLDEISPITNYREAFNRVKIDRQMKSYGVVLRWCKVFLLGDTFSPYNGKTVSLALLFDMNYLFESYMGEVLRGEYQRHEVKCQDRRHSLMYDDDGRGRFKLRPDFILKKGEELIVADSKWKILTKSLKDNYGIAQSDLYQMYAYGTKYDGCSEVQLIYPYVDEVKIPEYHFFKDRYEPRLKIRFYDILSEAFII